MSEPTDGELVGRARTGDGEAFSVLVARYQGHVYGLAYSLSDDWAEAQDIAQEAFVRAYLNLDQLRDPSRFAAWLRRVTFSVAMNWLKSFRPELFRQLDGRADLDALAVPDFRPGPPEVVERRELAEAVLRAIASLPPKYRIPLTMFHLDGLSYEKVASFLGIPISNARVLLHRARQRLKVLLAPYIIGEVTPMVQEVFNEHKLPPEFRRGVWGACMDWVCSADPAPDDPDKRRKRAERIALAALRDPDVAAVNEWRTQAEPIPQWAADLDARNRLGWGTEMCHISWLEHLARAIWMIGNETLLPQPSPAACGTIPASRRQWAALAVDAMGQWLAGRRASAEDPPWAVEIHSLLGEKDGEKAGAVSYLRDLVRAVLQSEDADEEIANLKPGSDLARAMIDSLGYARFECGYRWDKVVLQLCHAIGDPGHRASRPPEFSVGACIEQLAFAHRDDPLRVPTAAATLVGLWAWLCDVEPEAVESAHPSLAHLAAHTRQQLGRPTPAKRWLAGRLFVGIRMWLQEIDDGSVRQPRPVLEPYPTLVGP